MTLQTAFPHLHADRAALKPTREPTLAELADRAIAASRAFRLADPETDADEYWRRDNASLDARDALLARLSDLGLDKARCDALLNEGIIW